MDQELKSVCHGAAVNGAEGEETCSVCGKACEIAGAQGQATSEYAQPRAVAGQDAQTQPASAGADAQGTGDAPGQATGADTATGGGTTGDTTDSTAANNGTEGAATAGATE